MYSMRSSREVTRTLRSRSSDLGDLVGLVKDVAMFLDRLQQEHLSEDSQQVKDVVGLKLYIEYFLLSDGQKSRYFLIGCVFMLSLSGASLSVPENRVHPANIPPRHERLLPESAASSCLLGSLL